MMLAGGYLGFVLNLVTVVVPVAVYFLILGMLNTRKHPQCLSGRQDFALLILAFGPVVLLPIVSYFGASLPLAIGAAVALAGMVYVISPRGRTWVIYNVDRSQASKTILQALSRINVPADEADGRIRLTDSAATLRLSAFPLLRNVTIQLEGGDEDLARRFEQSLCESLVKLRAQTSPMALALLLVATAMLVAPLTMMAQNMPEIVRYVSDMVH